MPKAMPKNGKLVLIIGPSGVGKSVVLRALKERHPAWRFPRSATTRPRRPGEGTTLYHFVSEEEFSTLEREGKLLESARVHGGARYGTLLPEIVPPIETGETVIREVDVQGFESIRANPLFSGSQARLRLQTIFLLPENRDQLVAHITKRAPMAPEELHRRLLSMEKEMSYAPLCTNRIMSREGQIASVVADVERAILR